MSIEKKKFVPPSAKALPMKKSDVNREGHPAGAVRMGYPLGKNLTKKSKQSRSKSTKSKVNKQLILQALTDPKFRKLLATNPKKAIGVSKLSQTNKAEIKLALRVVKGIDYQISSLADELLCANGGCGIA
jgi:hypothetical protein